MEEVKWIKTQTYLALLFWKVIHLDLSMIFLRIPDRLTIPMEISTEN